ncbi:MAG: hypothetical protein RMK15_11340, partial [Chloroflexota bacterium]|nr:hypothetical protein [Chloroflexota bacterium]
MRFGDEPGRGIGDERGASFGDERHDTAARRLEEARRPFLDVVLREADEARATPCQAQERAGGARVFGGDDRG